eukprot:1979948-Ditylum_brightwellii.AAC.1
MVLVPLITSNRSFKFDMLSTFSFEQPAALSHLQHSAEQAYFKSNKEDKNAWTICSRMRHFCKFWQSHRVSDPCTPDKSQNEQNSFKAMYASHLAMGHTLLAKSIKSNTIMLFLKAAVLLCEPRRLISLLVSCCSRKSAWNDAVISEQRIWGSMYNRQEPFTIDIISFVCDLADKEGKIPLW